MRGIAALCVVFTHVIGFAPPLGHLTRRLLDATPFHVIFTGRAPVLFFFVLSGYVLTVMLLRPDAPRPAAFAVRRSIRLLLPVIAAVLLSAALRHVFYTGILPGSGPDLQAFWAGPADKLTVLREALLIGTDHGFSLDVPLWSLVHEWRISLLFPLVLLFRGRVALLIALALLLQALAVSAGAWPDAGQLGARLPLTLAETAYFATCFAAGAALRLAEPGLQLTGMWRRAAWITVLASVMLRSDLAVVVASVLLIVLAQGPSAFARLLERPALRGLGRVSYSLYLVHMPVIATVVYATAGRLPLLGALALGVPVAVLASIAFHAAIEQPAHVLSKALTSGGWKLRRQSLDYRPFVVRPESR